MPWILISKYSLLYLTRPSLCVSHAWVDRDAISAWITTQPTSCFGKSFTHSVEASYPKFFFFFPFPGYLQQHTLYFHMHHKQVSGQTKCQLIRCSFSVTQNAVENSDWTTMLSKSEAVLCPIGAVSKYGVDKTLVLASAFALASHQRHSQLPHCIITMPSGQWEGLL